MAVGLHLLSHTYFLPTQYQCMCIPQFWTLEIIQGSLGIGTNSIFCKWWFRETASGCRCSSLITHQMLPWATKPGCFMYTSSSNSTLTNHFAQRVQNRLFYYQVQISENPCATSQAISTTFEIEKPTFNLCDHSVTPSDHLLWMIFHCIEPLNLGLMSTFHICRLSWNMLVIAISIV